MSPCRKSVLACTLHDGMTCCETRKPGTMHQPHFRHNIPVSEALRLLFEVEPHRGFRCLRPMLSKPDSEENWSRCDSRKDVRIAIMVQAIFLSHSLSIHIFLRPNRPRTFGGGLLLCRRSYSDNVKLLLFRGRDDRSVRLGFRSDDHNSMHRSCLFGNSAHGHGLDRRRFH